MDKNIIKNAREYTLRLLKYTGRKPIYIICEDCCSEVSRLLALWFRTKIPKAEVYIAKGKIKKSAHDLILIKDDSAVYIIDPTIWQFFKNKRSIFVCKTKIIDEATNKLANIYGGKWKVSERMMTYSKNQIFELKRVLKKQLS